jgi:hypothetical protein
MLKLLTALSAAILSVPLLVLNSPAQEKPHAGPSWDLSRGDLKVSANKRFLVHADGTPFFFLGDTNWDFFLRARREDAERLLETRRQQGFTVICGPVTGILDSIYYKNPLGVTNPYGDLPFIDRDITRPAMTPGSDPSDPEQYDYWDHVDYLVSLAESKGMYVGLIPAWWDHYRAGLVNKANARAYGRFLGERYGKRRNIIWVLGGDTSIDERGHSLTALAMQAKWMLRWILKGVHPIEADTFREMAAGIKEGEAFRHLMTFHPRGATSSSYWFHRDDWLDFNMAQTGHDTYDQPRYRFIVEDYGKVPTKPTMDGEAAYEDQLPYRHWKNPEMGWYDDYDVRQSAYWGVFAGGHGYTYGNRGVWQMYEPGREPSDPVRYYWYDAMDLPGAWDMKHLRDLMLSRPMLSRLPDQSIVANTLSEGDHIRATRGDDYTFVYVPKGRTFTVQLGKITGREVVAWWFDPRNGTAVRIGQFPNTGSREFDPPGDPRRGNDWVLVLDDGSKGYGAPGDVRGTQPGAEAPG